MYNAGIIIITFSSRCNSKVIHSPTKKRLFCKICNNYQQNIVHKYKEWNCFKVTEHEIILTGQSIKQFKASYWKMLQLTLDQSRLVYS